jgi:hypothetical protein
MGVAAEDEVDGVVAAAAALGLVGGVCEDDGEVAGAGRGEEEEGLTLHVVVDAGDTCGGPVPLDEDVAVGEILNGFASGDGSTPVLDPGAVVVVAGYDVYAHGRVEDRERVEDGLERLSILGEVPGDGDEIGASAVELVNGAAEQTRGPSALEVDVGDEPDAESLEGGG